MAQEKDMQTSQLFHLNTSGSPRSTQMALFLALKEQSEARKSPLTHNSSPHGRVGGGGGDSRAGHAGWDHFLVQLSGPWVLRISCHPVNHATCADGVPSAQGLFSAKDLGVSLTWRSSSAARCVFINSSHFCFRDIQHPSASLASRGGDGASEEIWLTLLTGIEPTLTNTLSQSGTSAASLTALTNTLSQSGTSAASLTASHLPYFKYPSWGDTGSMISHMLKTPFCWLEGIVVGGTLLTPHGYPGDGGGGGVSGRGVRGPATVLLPGVSANLPAVLCNYTEGREDVALYRTPRKTTQRSRDYDLIPDEMFH
ncbi:hypothetical protein JZ751_003528 [Albula glossodonta]|uniref:Uncharacterized protein n=1 Tax=Albula glossodonta TaxID=121402 RepID=A0A8T2NAS2_9TELE|nr:hypothetical protein JZ751_003528 [Albula glossodonta]